MIGTGTSAAVGRILDVDGIRTFFIERGDGEAVVMLHGAGLGVCAEVTWQPNVEPLAQAGFWTIAYDQPGFGRSDAPADHSLEARILHARAFIDALGLTHYHLIGSSAGAYVAARLALEDPRVDRLALVAGGTVVNGGGAAVATPVAPTLDEVRALTTGSLARPEFVSEDLIRLRFEMSAGERFTAHTARAALTPAVSLLPQLADLRRRTLVLWGRNDGPSAATDALALFQAIPGAELHLFDRCGHWVQWDQAERFNRLVADFLRAP